MKWAWALGGFIAGVVAMIALLFFWQWMLDEFSAS